MNNKNDLNQFNQGGTHSENPLGGIPMGNNNTVEEGETIKNDFVYSNRITLTPEIIKQYNLPKSLANKTVADATKFIDNKFKDRTDKISMTTKNGMLSKIAEAQEAMKPVEPTVNPEQNQMFLGGEMAGVDPTALTGVAGAANPAMSGISSATDAVTSLISGDNDQALRSGIKAGTTIAGTAIGGPIGGAIGGMVGDIAGSFVGAGKRKREADKLIRDNHIKAGSQFNNDFAYGGKMYAKGGPIVPDADMLEIEKLKRSGVDNTINNDLAITEGINLPKNNFDPVVAESIYQKDKLQKANLTQLGNTLGQAARYAPIAMNAYQLSQLEKPSYSKLNRLDQKFKPEYVDEKSLQNIANSELNNVSNSLTSATNGSTGALRNNLLGASLNRNKALSDAYMNTEAQNRQTNMSGQQFNAGINATNLQQDNLELDINDRNSAAYRNERSKYLSEIGNNIGDVGKEEVYKNIISKSMGYKWDGEYVKTSEGQVVTDPITGEPMTEERLKQMQSINNSKKALGGYLIKNKRK